MRRSPRNVGVNSEGRASDEERVYEDEERHRRWVEVCRRETAIRELLKRHEGKRLKSSDVADAAWGQGTCRLRGGPLSERSGSHSSALNLRETSPFGERWWDGARAGESLVENYVAGQTSTPEAPIALMRLLLLSSWYRPGQPFNGFYNGCLLNELIPGFDDHARLVKRRVNQGATGSIPPDLRIALLAGLSQVAASPASIIDDLRPACRPIYRRHFEAFAAVAVRGFAPPIDI